MPEPTILSLPDSDHDRAFFEAFPDLVFEVSPEGRFLAARKGGQYQSVLPVEAFIGKTVSQMLPPEGALLGEQAFARMRKGMGPQVFEFTMEVAGTRRYYEVRTSILSNGNALVIIRNVSDLHQARQAHESQARLFKQFFELSPDAMWLSDEQGRISLWNKAAERLTGFSSEEVVGLYVWELVARTCLPERRQSVSSMAMECMHQALASGHCHMLEKSNEGPMMRRDGQIRQVRQTSFTLGTSQGWRMGSILHDISDLKRQEEELKLFKWAVDQSPVSVLITDAQGGIQYVNPRFSETSGYSAEEALGRKPSLLKSGETPDETYQGLWQTLLAGQCWRGEFINRRKDGSTWWEMASISPMRDREGHVSHFIGVQEDISQRKADEEVLEKRVAERTERVEQLLQQKDELIRHLGHDLRTPLTPLKALLPLLMQGEQDPERLRMLRLAEANARALYRMVARTLDYARLDSMAVELERIDLALALESANHEVAREVGLGMLDLSAVRGSQVKADRRLLHKALCQTLENAARFSPEAGTVKLRSWQDGDRIELELLDQGPGLEPGQLEEVFAPFFKADDSRHELGYVGLGLSIARRCVDRFQARLWAESEGLGKGCRMRFSIPAWR